MGKRLIRDATRLGMMEGEWEVPEAFLSKCSCVWWLGLVASSGKPGICSPLCFFCEENYNVKRKGGGEEHYILNSLREIIAKSVKLSHFSPCPPPRLL